MQKGNCIIIMELKYMEFTCSCMQYKTQSQAINLNVILISQKSVAVEIYQFNQQISLAP